MQPLGQGGMGTVWWARNELLGRDVALKLSDLTTDPELRERFMSEARILGKFRHPNIVGVIDAGELEEDGYRFLAMELLRGEPFSARLAKGRPLPPDEVLAILIDVCRGLSEAHAAGVIHRDIKPENIFLADTEAGMVPKIVDFGISRTVGLTITAEGQILGTPAYMSPEQAKGIRDITLAVDIWAMGVILYEALVGKQPFTGQNYRWVLRRILENTPLEMPPWIDAPVRVIIERCLQRNPSARYPDAASLREALERALEQRRSRTSAPTLSPHESSLVWCPTAVMSPSAAVDPSTRPLRRLLHTLLLTATCVGLYGLATFSRPQPQTSVASAALGPIALERAARLPPPSAASAERALSRSDKGREVPTVDTQRPTPTATAPRLRAHQRPSTTRVINPGF